MDRFCLVLVHFCLIAYLLYICIYMLVLVCHMHVFCVCISDAIRTSLVCCSWRLNAAAVTWI